MKIGFVTLYEHNYGSALQAFATKAFLEDNHIETHLIKNKRQPKVVNRLRLVLFCLFHLKSSKKILNILNSQRSKNQLLSLQSELCIKRFIETRLKPISIDKISKQNMNTFDYFLTGSDQVWNGFYVVDQFYFLLFADKKKRVAWAPSFGSKKIAEYNKKRYKKYINAFNKLSVREQSGKQIIGELCQNKIVDVLSDPVIVLTKDRWIELLNINVPTDRKKHVFCLFLNEPSHSALSYIKSLKAFSDYDFLTIGYGHQSLKDLGVNVYDGGPDMFVENVFSSSIVLTDSFHAMVFALISHTPFQVFERQYTHSQNQSVRIIDFLSECSLLDRLEPNSVDKWGEIDFTKFDTICEAKRTAFKKYLLSLTNE